MVVPFILVTLARALKGKFARHKAIAPYTLCNLDVRVGNRRRDLPDAIQDFRALGRGPEQVRFVGEYGLQRSCRDLMSVCHSGMKHARISPEMVWKSLAERLSICVTTCFELKW